ncbi:MAG TPA: RidA family protein [Bryobacteraceae bacterium]|nr:RidA family protein [Bryobacteraceae bacterium]
MSIERVFPHHAPTPRGPYSPAVRAGDFIFVSGQGPIDAVTDKLVEGEIERQTEVTLANIRNILATCGATPADVVKCSVFLRDIADFPRMNKVYAEFFGEARPARTTIEAKFHQPAMLVEIDCVAYKPR